MCTKVPDVGAALRRGLGAAPIPSHPLPYQEWSQESSYLQIQLKVQDSKSSSEALLFVLTSCLLF